jgi:ABC-type transport system substrate-binding protein
LIKVTVVARRRQRVVTRRQPQEPRDMTKQCSAWSGILYKGDHFEVESVAIVAPRGPKGHGEMQVRTGLPDEGGHVTNTYDRRQFLTQSAAAAGGVVATGALVDELVQEGVAGAVDGKIKLNGTIKFGVISEQNKPFTPDYANMDTSGFCYARAVYDPLMVVASDGKTVYPYLAKSMSHNAGYNAWTITARPGVKFHDGSPCNAQAIYANLVADFNSGLTGNAVRALIKGYSLNVAKQTVTVNTRYKWTTFPYTLAEQQIGFMAAPSTLGSAQGKNNDYHGNPIGTGPFVFASWNYNVAFVCTKNPHYWRPGLPYLAQIEFHPIPDGPTRFNALKSGSVDIIHEGEGDITKQFAGLGAGYTSEVDYPAVPKYSPSSNCMMLNCGKPPFKGDLNLRKACAYAIDRSKFVSVVDAGESFTIDGIFSKGSPYYKPQAYPKYNPTTAKAYVKKVPVGSRTFTLTYVSGDPAVLTAATLVQSMLGAVGLTVILAGVSQGQLIGDAIFGLYQAVTWSQFGGVSPDLDYPWFSTKSHLNFANNLDPVTEKLMLAGMAATSQTARTRAWAAVNAQINKDLPYLWTDRVVLGVAAKSYVQNWKTFMSPPPAKPILQPNQAVLFFTSVWHS